MSHLPVDVSRLPDDVLTGEEYGRRHYEALRNPKHPDHARVSAGFTHQCALDAVDQGLQAFEPLGPGGVAPSAKG